MYTNFRNGGLLGYRGGDSGQAPQMPGQLPFNAMPWQISQGPRPGYAMPPPAWMPQRMPPGAGVNPFGETNPFASPAPIGTPGMPPGPGMPMMPTPPIQQAGQVPYGAPSTPYPGAPGQSVSPYRPWGGMNGTRR